MKIVAQSIVLPKLPYFHLAYVSASVFNSYKATLPNYFLVLPLIVTIVIAVLIRRLKSIKGHRIPGWVIILFILCTIPVTIGITNLNTALHKTKMSTTVRDIRAIGTALGSYQIDAGMFPVLVSGTVNDIMFKTRLADGLTISYYAGAVKDGWATDFFYSSDSVGYTLKSYGKDKKPGGGNSGFDSDIIYINGSFVAPVY